MPFIFQFSHQLGNNLGIGLASEGNIAEIFVFDLGIIIDNSIMHNENFFVLVVVRMAISFIYLAAGCPSSVSDSNCGTNWLLGELLDKSLNTVQSRSVISFLCEFAQHFS